VTRASVFQSHPKDRPIQSPLTTHKGMLRIDSYPDPHRSHTANCKDRLQSGVKGINVVCGDTDVYVLHLHFYTELNLSCCFTMEGPSAERTTIGIGTTAHE
jgi:hypothetical protein